MKTIQRAFDYLFYSAEWIAMHFFQSFMGGFMFGIMYLGFVWFTAGLLVMIFGEERAISFVTNHPYLFTCLALGVLALTGGLALFAWTRESDAMENRLRSRLAKHNPLFKVAGSKAA